MAFWANPAVCVAHCNVPYNIAMTSFGWLGYDRVNGRDREHCTLRTAHVQPIFTWPQQWYEREPGAWSVITLTATYRV